MRTRFFACLLLMTAALRAAEPSLPPPAPFSAAAASAQPAVSLGMKAASLAAAERALALGFPSVAVDLILPLLEDAGPSVIDRSQLRLSCVTALLEDGRLEDARRILNEAVGLRGPAWHLRAGLIAANSKQLDLARAEVAQIKIEELSPADKGWFHFLQGSLADAAGKFDQGSASYNLAIESAQTELARVRFQLAREQAFLRRGVANIEQQRALVDRFQGQRVGYEASLQLAVGLDAAARKAEAVTVIQRLLQYLPSSESQLMDRSRLLLGLIDGAGQGSVGRNALVQLLESGQDADTQRLALHVLSAASEKGPAAEDFRRRLDKLIALPNPHRILESLLLYRAELALSVKDFARAEADARTLLDRFPGSQLRLQALGVLMGAAWEQKRYRLAADNASKMRQELLVGPLRAQLGLLVAEAWYRAGDYGSAADAYAAALKDVPVGVSPGALMFQRVLSEIDAGRLTAAQPLLDELSRDPSFDADSRWQAEWNLARALQAAGQMQSAYTRISSLVTGANKPADAELLARMAWLEVRLALESGKPADAVQRASSIGPVLEKLPAPLKAEIASSTALLKARAQLALGQQAEALASLQKLRSDFPNSPAAVYSLITEADYAAGQDRIADASQFLNQLVEQYKDSVYAPYALFRAALLAERLGQDTNLEEANKLIEQLVKHYPGSELVFYARLKQGDLLRKLNEFARAEQVYDSLVKNYPQHGDILAASMALADSHSAQGVSDPAHIDRALEIYEVLAVSARPDASVDLRVEAGYKLGASHVRRGEMRRAVEIWWRDVVNEFLAKPEKASLLGPKGRYWMARTLRDLATQLEQQGRNDEARRAWSLIVDSGLPGAAIAKARLTPPQKQP